MITGRGLFRIKPEIPPSDRLVGGNIGNGMDFFMRASALGIFIAKDELPILPREYIIHQMTLRADILFEMEPKGKA